MSAVERLDAVAVARDAVEDTKQVRAAALDALGTATCAMTDAHQARIDAGRAVMRAEDAHHMALLAYYAACAEMNS